MNRTTRKAALATTMLLTLLGGAAVTTNATAQTRAALVQDTDAPGRNPYQYTLVTTCTGLRGCNYLFPAVPAGMRLVVTRASGTANVIGNTAPLFNLVVSLAQPQDPQLSLAGSYYYSGTGVGGTSNTYLVNQETLAYFEPGQVPIVNMSVASGFFNDRTSFTLAGYYIKLP